MGHLRFFRRMKVAPGLTLNLSKSGGSLSFGPRGAKHTVGPRGRRTTVGLPGTGLFYTQHQSSGAPRDRNTVPGKPSQRRDSPGLKPCRESAPPIPTVPVKDRLTLGFFKRLITPAGEEAFVDACRELSRGDYDAALKRVEQSTDLTDGAFLA